MSLALTYDWCEALLTDTQKIRWKAYADQAVSNVWNPYGASWVVDPPLAKAGFIDLATTISTASCSSHVLGAGQR